MNKAQSFLAGFWILFAFSVWELAIAENFPTVFVYGPWLLFLAAYYGLLVYPCFPPELRSKGAEWWDQTWQKYPRLKVASLIYYAIYLLVAFYIGLFHPEFHRSIGSHFGPIMIISLLPVLAVLAAMQIDIFNILGRN